MQSKKRLLRIISTAAVIILCTANVTYCWQSISQTTLSIFVGESEKPDEPDKPEIPDKPDVPDTPEKPDEPDKPQQKPEISEKPKEQPKDSGSSSTQIGKAEPDTGDTHQYLRYLILMLLSFILMIVIGVTMIVSTINIVENRRRQ